MLKLNFNCKFEDLYSLSGLHKLNKLWLEYLSNISEDLFLQLKDISRVEMDEKSHSDFLLKLAPVLDDFIAELFSIKQEVSALSAQHHAFAVVLRIKRLFVQRVAVKQYKAEDELKITEVIKAFKQLEVDHFNEMEFAKLIEQWQISHNNSLLEYARIYCGWATLSKAGQDLHKKGVLFKIPEKLDVQNLIALERGSSKELYTKEIENRPGFSCTDKGVSNDYALDQASYCIKCHNQQKDSCSHGFIQPDSTFKINELGISLTGCPLDQKISEMNQLKQEGIIIGALAVVIIDNPMVAATGHRICNDCMKACIYQKQQPVNIPAIESNILDNILSLPWGFEIYSLLTRWNPLNFDHPLPKPPKPHKILIAGLGPAGFTVAHYLLNEGFIVAAIDGLKIEPVPKQISGIDEFGNRHEFAPIKNVKAEIYEDLSTRTPYGFGGVAEYGITVRWNKNYLKIIRLLLERRQNFRMYGGVRFGGTITYNDAKELGFSHIVLALGAGKPNLVDARNIMAKGCRTASDFLMSLQLSGAARYESTANLQIRLPVVVIGGGLTAVDAATESLAYYSVQVEKFLKNFELSGEKILKELNEEEIEIAQEFLEHARQLRASPEHKTELIKKWGGVKILYRKTLQESPAYRLNHEEMEKAFKEGIEFIENIVPLEVELDQYNAAKTLKHKSGNIAASTILVAAGTQPNTILSSEDPDHFILDGKYFMALNDNGQAVMPQRISKPKSAEIFHSMNQELSISFLGDLHPSFAGNVVKAMASAKRGYPKISAFLEKIKPDSEIDTDTFFKKLDDNLIAIVQAVTRLTPSITELIIKAPLAAGNFHPGQFYRFHNFEKYAITHKAIKLTMEGIALTGALVDKDKGLITLIVLEMGASSRLCQYLKPGEPVVLMGPTGTPTEIPSEKTVVLIGGGLGNAVLLSIGRALRAAGSKVIYFAGYKKAIDRYKIEEIQNAANVVVWCCDEQQLEKFRDNDFSVKGNIIEGIKAYGEGRLGDITIGLNEVEHMLVIGSDAMMKAVTYARHNELKSLFNSNVVAIGSINSPMQCMMKEICGQCLQRHVDPISGQESYVYSCFNQDQLLDSVDFSHLSQRLTQNSLQEKMCLFY